MKSKTKRYNDTFTMAGRCLLLSKRNPDTFLTSIILPALMMLLFISLFGNLIQIEGISYVDFIVPGILLQCIAQGSSTTAIMVNKDVTSGIVTRFSTLPINKISILNGHILEAFIRSIISTVVVVLIAILLGFRPSMHITDIGIVLILLVGIISVLSWLAVMVGVITNSAEGASSLSALAIILPYLSSGFVPTETLPSILKVFAEYQPMTSIIDTMRNAFLGNTLDTQLFITALAWCVGLTILFYILSLVLFKKRLCN
jgi:ABC-2 type transport system permease protein